MKHQIFLQAYYILILWRNLKTKMNTNTNDISLISTKLRILLLLHSLGASEASQLMREYENRYKVPLKKGSLHGTLSRLRVEGLIQSKIEIKFDNRKNETPIQLYKETEKGIQAINRVISDIHSTTNNHLIPI